MSLLSSILLFPDQSSFSHANIKQVFALTLLALLSFLLCQTRFSAFLQQTILFNILTAQAPFFIWTVLGWAIVTLPYFVLRLLRLIFLPSVPLLFAFCSIVVHRQQDQSSFSRPFFLHFTLGNHSELDCPALALQSTPRATVSNHNLFFAVWHCS